MTAPDITIKGRRVLAVWGPGPQRIVLLAPADDMRYRVYIWTVAEVMDGRQALLSPVSYRTLAAALDAGDRLRATLDIVTGCCEPSSLPREGNEMNEYEQKQEARRERLQASAARAAQASNAAGQRAHDAVAMIPFGQPILVGHYSERRHRAALARSDRAMHECVEQSRRAEELQRRADGVGTAGISGDDPDAIEKIEARIAELEAKRARMLAINKAHKAFLRDPGSLDAAPLSDADKARVRSYVPAYSWEPHPCAPYQFQNLGGNVRRLQLRVKQLRQRAAATAQDAEPVTEDRGGFTVERDAAANRLRLRFPGKPAPEVRAVLKRSGFRWAPSEGAWQCFLSTAGNSYRIEQVAKAVMP